MNPFVTRQKLLCWTIKLKRTFFVALPLALAFFFYATMIDFYISKYRATFVWQDGNCYILLAVLESTSRWTYLTAATHGCDWGQKNILHLSSEKLVSPIGWRGRPIGTVLTVTNLFVYFAWGMWHKLCVFVCKRERADFTCMSNSWQRWTNASFSAKTSPRSSSAFFN